MKIFSLSLLVTISVLITGLLLGCEYPKEQSLNDYLVVTDYVKMPRPNDELCLYDIERAKDSIERNGPFFIQEAGYLYGFNRYDEELKKLCNSIGINYELDLKGCFDYGELTQGCYGAIMYNDLENRYGIGYNEKLINDADSIYLSIVIRENIAISYRYCDFRPRLPSEKSRKTDYFPPVEVMDIDLTFAEKKYHSMPFMDIEFIVNLDSTISNFKINYFSSGHENNAEYKVQLFSLLKFHIQNNYPVWIPGLIKNKPVRVKNNIRVSFFTNGKD